MGGVHRGQGDGRPQVEQVTHRSCPGNKRCRHSRGTLGDPGQPDGVTTTLLEFQPTHRYLGQAVYRFQGPGDSGAVRVMMMVAVLSTGEDFIGLQPAGGSQGQISDAFDVVYRPATLKILEPSQGREGRDRSCSDSQCGRLHVTTHQLHSSVGDIHPRLPDPGQFARRFVGVASSVSTLDRSAQRFTWTRDGALDIHALILIQPLSPNLNR